MNPHWELTGDFGISIDAYNWKLMQKAVPKQGGKPNWKVVGYYPTLKKLMAGLQNKALLTYTDSSTLKHHLESVVELSASAVNSLNSQLNTIGAGADTKPPAYAQFIKE